MEEIQSRLEIIRLAVDLGDQAAVNHQVTHLRNLTTDTDLHAILDELERHNFHQALFAMREYRERRERGDDFFAPQSAEPEAASPSEPQVPSATEELFGLEEPDAHRDAEEHILSVDEMLAMTRESATPPRAYEPPPSDPTVVETPAADDPVPEPASPDTEEMALFDLGEEEESPITPAPEMTPPDPVTSLTTLPEEESPETLRTASPAETAASESGLFDLDDHIRAAEEQSSTAEVEPFTAPSEPQEVSSELFGSAVASETVSVPAPEEEMLLLSEPEAIDLPPVSRVDEEVFVASDISEGSSPSQHEPAETAPAAPELPDEYEPAPDEPRYEAFAYMGQKFRNMLHQFPQKIPYEDGVYIEAQRFIDRISTEDYTESQVEAMIARYQELKAEGHLAEAAQVLIAAATTESTFAQFMLARELFKGDVLKPDHAEAFTQINRMAEEDYPEAICDLGQLYEHGIGIDRNKRHALLLYEEAAAMGIERARQHYERLRRTNPIRNLTSLFSRR